MNNKYKMSDTNKTDCLIIGGGIMSLTLASLIKEIDPSVKIDLFERLNDIGLESSEALNNAGTGHAGYCELNYTPADTNGKINIKKALEVNSKYEITLQYWSYLTKKYSSFNPRKFINRVPHLSFVFGNDGVKFLKRRYLLLKKHHLFKSIRFSENKKEINKCAPLIMAGRNSKDKIAITKVNEGSDVDFGKVSKELLTILKIKKKFTLHLSHEVLNITEIDNNSWKILVQNNLTNQIKVLYAKFVFIGAGGRAIQLLQKTNIKEQIGYAGFPVSGQWLVCKKKEIVDQHYVKVYGMGLKNGPAMVSPHLDLRIIDGKKTLLFGPFAGFTFKFLKYGSYLDLIKSLRFKNFMPMIYILFKNWGLLIYLIRESFQTKSSRIKLLKKFYPNANSKDWSIKIAGQRVQIIKPRNFIKSNLVFGTEIIFSQNKTLAALLGASPGASVAVDSMIQVIEQYFLNRLSNKEIKNRLSKIIPSYGENLMTNKKLLRKIRNETHKTLGLNS